MPFCRHFGFRNVSQQVKRMNNKKTEKKTMIPTYPPCDSGGEGGSSAGIILVRFSMYPRVHPASLPWICRDDTEYKYNITIQYYDKAVLNTNEWRC